MHDLRKKVLLESGKTVSRKARLRPDSNVRSRPNSNAGSRAGSKAGTPITSPEASPLNSHDASRAGSGYASENENPDSEDDDSTTTDACPFCGHDYDDETVDHDEDESPFWEETLQLCVTQLTAGGRSGERKKTGNEEREATLTRYLHLVRHYYAQSEIKSSIDGIVLGLLKSAVQGASAKERVLSLKGLAVTLFTNPTDTFLDEHITTLKTIIERDESEEVKVAAIHTLAVAALYGDGSCEAAEDMLQYLVEIVESDGHLVDAPDSADVVVAALKSWGFVAAHLEDLTDQNEQAMDAFVEQLDSTDVHVVTSAGENIALLFETARNKMGEENGEKLVFKYDPERLARQLCDMRRGAQKSLSKQDKRHLKANLRSIITALRRGKGPRYSEDAQSLINPHTGEADGGHELGYRIFVYIGRERVCVETWELQAKLEFLRIILAGGFSTHLAKSETVKEMM